MMLKQCSQQTQQHQENKNWSMGLPRQLNLRGYDHREKERKRREPNIQPLALQGTSGQQAERVTGKYSKEQSFCRVHIS